jgi:hypothetical protein
MRPIIHFLGEALLAALLAVAIIWMFFESFR